MIRSSSNSITGRSSDRHRRGSGGGGSAGHWTTADDIGDLLFAWDFRGGASDSVLTKDGAGGVYGATDLSGNGRDFVSFRAPSHAKLARQVGDAGDAYLQMVSASGRSIETRPTLLGFTADFDIHAFIVLQADSSNVFSQASSSSAANRYGAFGGLGGFVLALDGGGGAANPSNIGALGDLGTPVWQTEDETGPKDIPVNFESLSGRAETDAANRRILVELRADFFNDLAQIWVNGKQVGELALAATVTDSYMTFGKTDINGAPRDLLRVFSIGYARPSVLTLTKAAAIRAALLADHGIEVWDGSTYPS